MILHRMLCIFAPANFLETRKIRRFKNHENLNIRLFEYRMNAFRKQLTLELPHQSNRWFYNFILKFLLRVIFFPQWCDDFRKDN